MTGGRAPTYDDSPTLRRGLEALVAGRVPTRPQREALIAQRLAYMVSRDDGRVNVHLKPQGREVAQRLGIGGS